MRKLQAKLSVLLIVALFAVFCLAGCDVSKDVYGAASDYIKVSHPDNPNDNAFSEDGITDDKDKTDTVSNSASADKGESSKGEQTKKDSSVSDKTSEEKSADAATDSATASDSSKDSSSSGKTVTIKGNGSDVQDITYDPSGGDYGPMVTF